DGDEPAQQLTQFQRPHARVGALSVWAMEAGDRVLEALAAVGLDEPHGVGDLVVGLPLHAVDRDDAGMLQPASGLGFEDELGPTSRVAAVAVLDPLQRDRPAQLLVNGDEDLAQAAPAKGAGVAISRRRGNLGEALAEALDQAGMTAGVVLAEG